MSRMTTWAVLLTGAPGAGKTSVLEKLATLLEIEGVEFGALESEQLGWGSPWLSGELWLGQLRAVLDLQRQAGRRRFLIAATTETSDDLAAVRDAIAVD
jgi:predicted ATPase